MPNPLLPIAGAVLGVTGLVLASNEKLSDQLINLQNKFEIVVEELALVKKN